VNLSVFNEKILDEKPPLTILTTMLLIDSLLKKGGKKVNVTFHSYKGGTGKTLLSVNLAVTLVRMGKRVCLLDLDMRAPSLHSIFKNGSNYWMNDYLSKACSLKKVLVDCTSKEMGTGKLVVGLANPSTEAIREMGSKSRAWEMEALARLLSLKCTLLNDMGFDYVFCDASPGLNYSAINAIVSADVVLLVTSVDRSDVEGTQRMVSELYEVFGKKTGIIMNRIPSELCSTFSKNLEIYHLPVVGVVPCSCDILGAAGKCLFACEKLDHPFTKRLQEIAAKIEHLTAVRQKRSLQAFTLSIDMVSPANRE
jgi:MinD-like ATPase involved in chromosome partitioning or flagellar assembly